jgi:hypothetical protein
MSSINHVMLAVEFPPPRKATGDTSILSPAHINNDGDGEVDGILGVNDYLMMGTLTIDPLDVAEVNNRKRSRTPSPMHRRRHTVSIPVAWVTIREHAPFGWTKMVGWCGYIHTLHTWVGGGQNEWIYIYMYMDG